MSDDILARIDAAIGCHSCGGLLADDAPSGDFCSPECQAEWHAGHGVPLAPDRAEFTGFLNVSAVMTGGVISAFSIREDDFIRGRLGSWREDE